MFYARITRTVASVLIALNKFILTVCAEGLKALASEGFTALGTTRICVVGTYTTASSEGVSNLGTSRIKSLPDTMFASAAVKLT
jgi:hypothetical protein